MMPQCELLYGQLIKLINACEHSHSEFNRMIECAFLNTQRILVQLNELVKDYVFTNDREQIEFYKHIQPRFRSWEEYYALIYAAQTALGLAENAAEFWIEEKSLLEKYFTKHHHFYRYISDGLCDQDERYFVIHAEPAPACEAGAAEGRRYYSRLVAKFIARERYAIFIDERLRSIGDR